MEKLMKKLIEKILIKLGILANEQQNKICNDIDLQLEKERKLKMSEYTGTYVNDDGNHYCPKCKNIILLPNAATPLCNTCFKEEYEENEENKEHEKQILHYCPECGLANFEPLSNTDLCRDCYKKQFKDEVFNRTENTIIPGETFINGKTYSNQDLFELGVIQINKAYEIDNFTFDALNTKTVEGKLLLSALSIFTTTEFNFKNNKINGSKKHPEDICKMLKELAKDIFINTEVK
jgi:hypothetical protein